MIVSDHGAKRMDGGVCFNDWLIQEGYLTLKATPQPGTKFAPALVDWTRTRAWGDGGYYGRVFLNVQGREPQGIVPPEEAEALKLELTAKLEAMPDEHGSPLNNRVFRPETLYAHTRSVPPDLIVYFGDLHWRSVGSLGHPSIWTHDNDTGPDDANHAQHGIFIMAEAKGEETKRRKEEEKTGQGTEGTQSAIGNQQSAIASSFILHPSSLPNSLSPQPGLSIYDIAPTVLNALGIAPPPGMGRNAIGSAPTPRPDSAYSEEEEAELARRLEDLGYL